MKGKKSFSLWGIFISGIFLSFVFSCETKKPEEKTKTEEEIKEEIQKEVEKELSEIFGWAIMIHFDDPRTPDIEGVNINPDLSCRGCHFSKEGAPRLAEWGRSGHGGKILEVKEKDMTAAVTREVAPAFVYYNFSATDRAICQRCHTSTGFKNFAKDPVKYNPADNKFYLSGEQREMIYCWACHEAENLKPGEVAPPLRNPGRFEFTSPYTLPADRIASVPDLGSSNACVSCHSGRSSGAVIKASSRIRGHFGGFNPHYLASAGVMFRTIGYEFEGKDYTVSNPHSQISSPCVSCHMPAGSHMLEVVKKDSSGKITDIVAYDSTCSKCHVNKAQLIEKINFGKQEFEQKLKQIEELLAKKGIYYNEHAYPYFYKVSDPAQQTFQNAFTDWTSKDLLGAAFNFQLMKKEPGAYVHNPEYAKKLIEHTIEFLSK